VKALAGRADEGGDRAGGDGQQEGQRLHRLISSVIVAAFSGFLAVNYIPVIDL
jgi:hypothetical protein